MANKLEEIKRKKDGLDVLDDIYRYAELGFDAIEPDDLDRMKWYGLFHRKATPGSFMMRLRIPNGVLTSQQMTAIGEIANRYCRGKADLTTRQNIQLRWILIEDVPAIFAALKDAGVGHQQTGLDNFRNITGCPISGLDPHEVIDVTPLAHDIQNGLLWRKEFSNLPRKLNISISGCRDDCGLSQTHDIGLTPATKSIDGETVVGFNVRLGGAVGGKSRHFAWELDAFVLPEEVVDLCRVILVIFRDEGSRANRQYARLKWLVEKWGIDRFRSEVECRLGRKLDHAGNDAVRTYGGDHIGVRMQKQSGLRYVGCVVPVGRITGDELIEFARLADAYGDGQLRLTNDQNVLIVNVPKTRIDTLLGETLLQRFSPFPAPSFRRLVACTGNDYCHYSLIDTKARAVEVAERLDVLLPDANPLRMFWSGCPNACGQHHIADIGFQAARIRVNGEIIDAADVYVGGQLGANARFATPVLQGVPISELPERLSALLQGAKPVAADQVETEPIVVG